MVEVPTIDHNDEALPMDDGIPLVEDPDEVLPLSLDSNGSVVEVPTNDVENPHQNDEALPMDDDIPMVEDPAFNAETPHQKDEALPTINGKKYFPPPEIKELLENICNCRQEDGSWILSPQLEEFLEMYKNRSNVKLLCGVSPGVLKFLVEIFEKVLPSQVLLNNNHFVSQSERDVKMVLAFLKHNTTINLLAVVFQLCENRTRYVLKKSIRLLFVAVGKSLIWWPTSEVAKTNASIFRNFPEVTAIIDCTEARTERPRCDGCFRRLI